MASTRVITLKTSTTAVLRCRRRASRRSTIGSPSQPSSAANTNGLRIGASSQTTHTTPSASAVHCTRR